MRLYYRRDTGRPFRVAWALEELGVPYEAIGVGEADVVAPTHLARNPLGRVPVLELDDGTTLFDSTALVLQVGDMYPDVGLIGPLGSVPRGLAYQWCLTAMTELERPAVNELHGYGVPDQRDAFAAGVEAFADALDGHDFLVADKFGVADIVFGGVLLVGRRAGFEPDAVSERIVDYLAALEVRPAFVMALARTESIFR
jgi:glutathione S-transferase